MTMNGSSSDSNVQVVVRVRPSSGSDTAVEVRGPREVLLATGRQYHFDAVLGPESGQDAVFRLAGQPSVESCLAGYNSAVLAYGPTGSGKTHTMLGDIPGHVATTPRTPTNSERVQCRRRSGVLSRSSEDSASRRSSLSSLPSDETPAVVSEGGAALSSRAGLTPRVFEYLFSRIEALRAEQPGAVFSVRASFYEIYNEIVTDLLGRRSNLAVRQVAGGSAGATRVEGAEEREVADLPAALSLIAAGLANRNVAGTATNEVSSRSHAVLRCAIECRQDGAGGVARLTRATLNLVDLAGSERQRRSGAAGQRLKEAASINKSLSALSHVVTHVVQGSRHVPYRDSKLTHLLQDSLGGNARAVLIAAISPCPHSLRETESTLGFAARAAQMANAPIVNEDALGDVAALKAENLRLRSALGEATGQATKLAAENERLRLLEQLAECDAKLHAAQMLEPKEELPPADSDAGAGAGGGGGAGLIAETVERPMRADAETATEERPESQAPLGAEEPLAAEEPLHHGAAELQVLQLLQMVACEIHLSAVPQVRGVWTPEQGSLVNAAGSPEAQALDIVACEVQLEPVQLPPEVEPVGPPPTKDSRGAAAPQELLVCEPALQGGNTCWRRILRQSLVPAAMLAGGVLGVTVMAPSGRSRGFAPAPVAPDSLRPRSDEGSRRGPARLRRAADDCAFGGEGCLVSNPDPACSWQEPRKATMSR